MSSCNVVNRCFPDHTTFQFIIVIMKNEKGRIKSTLPFVLMTYDRRLLLKSPHPSQSNQTQAEKQHGKRFGN
jgi:hypothetical protein